MGNKAKPLRSGFTTGSCAAAAARGAALMLKNGTPVEQTTITLPDGSTVSFILHGQVISTDSASCHVIKDAGDDPDITNGAEIHVSVTATSESATMPLIVGGVGIGKITKPGLAVPPGDWAINPIPRRMIAEAVHDCLPRSGNLKITVSIPDGEERAKKTLNARLGIIGGLSILGTTGIVRPISAKAWTDTVDTALDVARACGCGNVVLSTGRTSELAAQRHLQHLPFPDEACIMMGDHVAHTLRSCLARGYAQPMISCQFAKLFKIACGYENTHAAASDLDLNNFARWAESENFPASVISTIRSANTAREIIVHCNFDTPLIELVCRHALQATQKHAPGISPRFLLADYGGEIVFNS